MKFHQAVAFFTVFFVVAPFLAMVVVLPAANPEPFLGVDVTFLV